MDHALCKFQQIYKPCEHTRAIDPRFNRNDLNYLFSEQGEKKLEVCTNQITVHDCGCASND